MRIATLGFLLGIMLLQRQAALPAIWTLCLLLLVILPLCVRCVARRNRTPRLVRHLACFALGVSIGFTWAGLRAEWRMAEALPDEWQSTDIELRGVISGLPQRVDDGWRFELDIEQASAPVPSRVLLSWYAGSGGGGGESVPALHPGERWQLLVRLKRPHGFSNPNGFDYEAWLLERNLRATGYVRATEVNRRIAERVPGAMLSVHRWRDRVRQRFGEMLPDQPYVGVLIALAVGDQRAIPREQWEVFRHTGVAHLVSISGLHISLVALLFGGLIGYLWRCSSRLLLRVPVRRVAALAGLLAAAAYAAIAGLGLPTQRALLMLAVLALALTSGREVVGSRTLLIALAVVLALDPWSVLSAGFWLSFGAVAVILLVASGRRPVPGRVRAAVVIQLAIGLFTLPVLIGLFGSYPLSSPLANAFAIPLVSFVITPLVLAAVILPWPPLLELAHWVCGWMMRMLEWFAMQPLALWEQAAPPEWMVVLALTGVLWLLLPQGTPGRPVAVLVILPMLLWTPLRPAQGEFRATVLDVGHGLAVHIVTASHDLLFDAGPRYGNFSDAGERVLVTYLKAAGTVHLDRLVITHDDIDHTGGAGFVLRAFPLSALMANLRPEHPLRHVAGGSVLACHAGDAWTWDGVSFVVLHPASDESFTRDNDTSCVLRVAGIGGSLLLTGDIEAAAEQRLVRRGADRVASDVVVVPHHGSRSSSSAAFVDATGASDALFPVGNRNPFGHPHPSVEARWRAAGAQLWRTDQHGALIVGSRGDRLRVTGHRTTAPRYWNAR